jgi:HK97 family phage prohead protease
MPAYREQFAPGSFDRQLEAPHRVEAVLLNFEHDQNIRGIVGHAVGLESRADGLHGEFRALRDADGDKALQLVNEGLLRGLSLEFAAIKSRVIDGVVTRLHVKVDKVSLCRNPAYKNAAVLAVREQLDELDDDDLEADDAPARVAVTFGPVDPIPATMLDRLEALGIAVKRPAETE